MAQLQPGYVDAKNRVYHPIKTMATNKDQSAAEEYLHVLFFYQETPGLVLNRQYSVKAQQIQKDGQLYYQFGMAGSPRNSVVLKFLTSIETNAHVISKLGYDYYNMESSNKDGI